MDVLVDMLPVKSVNSWLMLAGLVLLMPGCALMSEATSQNPCQDPAWVMYRSGAGLDMYQDGDTHGYAVSVRRDGGYILCERIWRDNEGESSVYGQQIGRGELDGEQLEAMQDLMSRFDVAGMPARLPDVDPRRVQLREPAETVTIAVVGDEGQRHTVRAHMGADHRHYPEGFLELRNHFDELLRELRQREEER